MIPQILKTNKYSSLKNHLIKNNQIKYLNYRTSSNLHAQTTKNKGDNAKSSAPPPKTGFNVINKTYHDLIVDQVNLYPHKDFSDTITLGTVTYENTLRYSKELASGLIELLRKDNTITYTASSSVSAHTLLAQLGAPLAGKIFGSIDYNLYGEDFIRALNATRAGIVLYGTKVGSRDRVEKFYESFNYLKARLFTDGRPINDHRVPTVRFFVQDSIKEHPGLVPHLNLMNSNVNEREFRIRLNNEDYSSIFLTPEFETVGLSQYNILNTGNAVGELLGITADDIVITTLQPFRASGQSLGIGLALTRRSKLIIPHDVTNPVEVLEKLSTSKGTVMIATQSEWNTILSDPSINRIKPSSLVNAIVVLDSTEKVDGSILQKIKDLTKVKNIHTIRGNDETSGVISVNEKPLPNTDVKIVGSDGKQVKNSTGNVYIKGYNVMKGYWNNEALTKQKKDVEGWLNTGLRGSISNDGTLNLEI